MSRCKMYPEMMAEEATSSQTLVMGVAPPATKSGFEAAAAGAENGGCKCGDNCTCNPCTCK